MSGFGICLDPSFQENQESLTCDLPEEAYQKLVNASKTHPDHFIASGSKGPTTQLRLAQFHKQIYQEGIKGISSMPTKSFGVGNSWMFITLPFALAACNEKTEDQPKPPLLKTGPHDIEIRARFILVSKYLREKRDDLVMVEVRKILELEPNHPLARVIIGDIYYDRENFDAAVKEYENAHTTFPKDKDIMDRLARTYYALGNWEAAKGLLQKLLEYNQHSFPHRKSLASAMFELGEIDAAKKEIKKALETNPDDLFARFLLGKIYQQEGNLQSAKKEYQRVIELNPTHAGAQLAAVWLREIESQLEEGEKPKP